MCSRWPTLNRSRQFYALLIICLIAPLDVPLISPVLPTIGESFAISDARSSLTITAFATGAFLAAPVLGMVADQFRRRRLLVCLLVLYGTVGLSIPFSPSFDVLVGLRFVQGLFGGAILTSLAITVAGDVYDGVTRSEVVGHLSASLSIGVAVYPAIGGFLAEFGWQYPFLMYGWALPAAVLSYVWIDDPSADTESPSSRHWVRNAIEYLRNSIATVPKQRASALLGGVTASFLLLNGAMFTAVPFYLSSYYGLASGNIGSLLTTVLLVTAVVSTLNGRFATRVSSSMLVALGFGAYGVGLIMATVAGSVPAFMAVLVVFGVGHGLTLPTIATELTTLVPIQFRAGLLSLRTSAVVASQALGPVLYTSLEPLFGYPVLLLWSGLLSLVGAIGTAVIVGGYSIQDLVRDNFGDQLP